jgi:opacity protein-like surface antigen
MKKTFIKGLVSLLALGNAASFASAETPVAPIIALGNFDGARLNLTGDASIQGSSLRLTQAKNWLQGVALYNSSVALDSKRSFSASFSFEMSDPNCNSSLGADGISFVLQSGDKPVHAPGNGVGYSGTEMSVAIEFDTFVNGEFKDPSDQHIGLSLHGDPVSYSTAISPYTLNDGRTYYSWVEYDGSSKFLEVRIADSNNRPEKPTLRSQVDLSSVLADKVFVGFSASTGACNEQHVIKSLYFHDDFIKDGIAITAKGS